MFWIYFNVIMMMIVFLLFSNRHSNCLMEYIWSVWYICLIWLRRFFVTYRFTTFLNKKYEMRFCGSCVCPYLCFNHKCRIVFITFSCRISIILCVIINFLVRIVGGGVTFVMNMKPPKTRSWLYTIFFNKALFTQTVFVVPNLTILPI